MLMFNNSNAADHPVMIKVTGRQGNKYVTTQMPAIDNSDWQNQVRKSYINPRKPIIAADGNIYEGFGISEAQLQDYITYGKMPAGCNEYPESVLMKNLYGIFKNK